MKILALDTSTLMATVAVIEDDKLIGEYSINQDMSHSENLVPMIIEVLKNLNFKIEDIDAYAVGVGPGSFTGLRIGIATMKGFAHVFDKPIIGVSTLEALAFNMAYSKVIIPMIDARRDRAYTAIYKWENEDLVEILEPQILEIEEILEIANKYDEVYITGNASKVYEDIIKNNINTKYQIAKMGQNVCRASSIAEIGLNKLEQGLRDDYFTLAPSYLRETQAQRELNLKNKRG